MYNFAEQIKIQMQQSHIPWTSICVFEENQLNGHVDMHTSKDYH